MSATCPACTDKRFHTPADWAHHPHAGHGFNGSVWTHPDLQVLAGIAISQGGSSGEVLQVEPAVPAGVK
jgi:hypothetical protein